MHQKYSGNILHKLTSKKNVPLRTRKIYTVQSRFSEIKFSENMWFYKDHFSTFHIKSFDLVQVNLCQKLLFLHQLTHNMTTYCSLNYKFNTWKFQDQNMGRTYCVQKLILTFRTIYVYKMFSQCSAKIGASDKYLPVKLCDLVTVFAKTKSVTKSRLHCIRTVFYNS